jgi:hypothetical protein
MPSTARSLLGILVLALFAGCTKPSAFPPCRKNGVHVRTVAQAESPPRRARSGRAEDAVSITFMPGWALQAAKYGPGFAEEVEPVLFVLHMGPLGALQLSSSEFWKESLFPLAEVLTLDPGLPEQGLDDSQPVVVRIRPGSPEHASIFLQLMVIPGELLPMPRWLVQVGIPSKDPARMSQYLQRILTRKGTCVSSVSPAGKPQRACMLRKPGLAVFAEDDGLLRVDILSGDDEDCLSDLRKSYLELVPGMEVFGMADVREAAAELRADEAVLALTIPGRAVTPLLQVRRRDGNWVMVKASASGSRSDRDMSPQLAAQGYRALGYHMLALPGRLEVESTHLALLMGESVRVKVDVELTDHGARLADLGLRRLAAGGHGAERSFDVDRLLSAVEPNDLLNLYDGPYGGKVREEVWFATDQFLQAPAMSWRTMASTMKPGDQSPAAVARAMGKWSGLAPWLVSWRGSIEGQGTMAEIVCSSLPKDGKKARSLLAIRAWLASNRRLRVDACILPERLPCRQSSCSGEIVLEDLASTPEAAINPCWEQALREARWLLGTIAMLRFPEIGGPEWYQHAVPLHAALQCAAKDPRFADDARELDEALWRFEKQKGILRGLKATPRSRKDPVCEEDE